MQNSHHIYKSDNEKKGRVVNHFIFYFDFKRDTLVGTEQVYRDLQVNSYEDNPDTYGFPRHIKPYVNPK